jgi:formylmethanofuran dehydrogenase subunit E
MSQVITRADGLELALCEPCGNYTPVQYLDGDIVCKYCYDSDPDLF